MNTRELINRLEANAAVLSGLVEDLPPEQITWKPSPEEWSVLEVICHLLDEEREDFRARIDGILHRPEEDWTPIDPQGWVEERSYGTRDLGDTLRAFLAEREHSVSWLRGLDVSNWEALYQHPTLGPLRAGDLLASWLAHDFLHMRQLVSLHWRFHSREARPYEVSYAGDW